MPGPDGRGIVPPLADETNRQGIACDVGDCLLADAGVSSACVPKGPRDCNSELDNDCDGQPDNVVDDVCVCALGTSDACDEHPGRDGNGVCRGGLRTCVVATDGRTPSWSACEGSVGPHGPDSCTVRGDDADCDGIPNSGCPCVDGDSQPCGSSTDLASCAFGISTCVNGRFGVCTGAIPPAAQDSCVPGDDSNCNGLANDRFCVCLDGDTQACGVTDTGVCQLGTRTCANGSFGPCIGAAGPFTRDCQSAQDNDCDGRPDNTIDGECLPDVLVVGSGIEPSLIAVTSDSVFALSMAGVIRLSKNGSSQAGGEPIAAGRFALSGYYGVSSSSGDLVFWNTSGTSLVRLGTDGIQSTVAEVGSSSFLAPIATEASNVYWVEQHNEDFTFLRSNEAARALTDPRTILGAMTLSASVKAIAGLGDCVFAVVEREGSDRIDRVCLGEAPRSLYPAQGPLGSLAIDTSGLYFIEEGIGLRRLAPLDSSSPGTVTLAAGASSVVTTADFVYFVQNGRSPAGTCGLNSSIRALAKTGSAARTIQPGPLSCPVSLAVDDQFLYWSDTAGFVTRSRKDAQ